MKRLSFTHGIRLAEHKALMVALKRGVTHPGHPLHNLAKELIGIDTPDIVQNRIACESTTQGNRENSPELYGRTLRETRQKYMGDVHNFKPTKSNCDPELNEIESIIVAKSGHNVEVE